MLKKTVFKTAARKSVKGKLTKALNRLSEPGKTDAIALLKADHRTVEDLFERFEKAAAKAQKARIAEQICTELIIHSMIEEEIFYPLFRNNKDVKDNLLNEAYVEHDGAKLLIAEILAGDPSDKFYDAKVKVLSEEIKHHVKEEEKMGGIFSQAKKTDVDMKDLGAALARRKAELKKEFAQNGLPTPETRTLAGAELVYSTPPKAQYSARHAA